MPTATINIKKMPANAEVASSKRSTTSQRKTREKRSYEEVHVPYSNGIHRFISDIGQRRTLTLNLQAIKDRCSALKE
ncbi:hypothetical protein GQ457_10G008760 [Hibiscus cannabinus]